MTDKVGLSVYSWFGNEEEIWSPHRKKKGDIHCGYSVFISILDAKDPRDE